MRDAPYLNKPPLFFWTVALGAWPTGRVSDREAPIPSIAAALATLLGVFAIGRRLSGAHAGFIALVVLATSPGFFFLSHEVLPDMMFTAWLTWALYFLLRGLSALPPRPAHLVGFYVCVAGALWTKGLPALDGDPGNRRGLPRFWSHPAAALAAPVDGPGSRGADGAAVGNPHALTPEHASSQAIGASHAVTWYFDRYRTPSSIPSPAASVTFLPWALWLIPVAVWWRLSPDRQAYRPVLAWMLVFVVLVGLSVQQRARYLLPVYPILALFVAAAVTAGASRARAMIRLQHHHPRRHARRGAGHGRMAPPRESADLGDADRRLRLHRDMGARAPRGARHRGARHRPPRFGRAAHRAAHSAGSQAPWPSSSLFEATTYSGRLETTYRDPLVRRPRPPSLDRNAPLLAYPDASLAFDFYLDHPIAEVSARQTIAGHLQSPAAGALLLRDVHWEDLRRTTHPSWCPIDRVNLGYRSFVLLGACR